MNGLHQSRDQKTARAVRASASSKSATKKTPNSIDKHIGHRIRMRRMMLGGMSQERLADKLGITFQQVQKYEKGTNRVSGSRLDAIATALSAPVQFFFEGAPGGSTTQEVSGYKDLIAFEASSEGLRIMAAYNRLPDDEIKRRIVAVVETISATACAAAAAGGRRVKN